jgi:6-phosphofructokinase 1
LASYKNGQPDLFSSPLLGDNIAKNVFGGSGFLPQEAFVNDNCFVTSSFEFNSFHDVAKTVKYVLAGAREKIMCNPKKTKVCIVTCGGLCPGLNVVIRELFMTLHYNYEVKEIYGIKWGYKGFYTDIETNWVRLTPGLVKNIHRQGGTMLGSSRGGFDADKILDSLKERGIT